MKGDEKEMKRNKEYEYRQFRKKENRKLRKQAQKKIYKAICQILTENCSLSKHNTIVHDETCLE